MVKAPDNDVKIISVRSANAKRAAPRDQASTNVSKRARSSASTSRRSISPRRDYPRGTDTATKPALASPGCAEDRPVHAQDLEVFKADMTSMLADMLNSSLAKFASQLTPGSEGQGDSVLFPQGQSRPLLISARRGELESLFEDENFS